MNLTPSEKAFIKQFLSTVFDLFSKYSISYIEINRSIELSSLKLSVSLSTSGDRQNRGRKYFLRSKFNLDLDGVGAAAETKAKLTALFSTASERELELLVLLVHRVIYASNIKQFEMHLGRPISGNDVDDYLLYEAGSGAQHRYLSLQPPGAYALIA